MKVHKPITLYIPKLFDEKLDKYLFEHPPNFKYQKCYFFYLVHYLTILQVQYKKEEYFTFNRDFLKNVTISNIERYIKILKNGEFIISDNTYIVGVKSLKYKLNLNLIRGVKKVELPNDSNLSRSILKKRNNEKAHYNRLEPHLRAMQLEFMKMEIDYQSAINWVENNSNETQKLSYLTSINHIEDKRFRYFIINKTNGRLNTNLTNLKSDLRQFIKGDYVSIDLKNSQPFLLGLLIDSIINSSATLCCKLDEENLIKVFGIKAIKRVLLIHQNQEKEKMVKFRNYYNSVLTGKLYDDFIDKYSENIERKEVKEIMFKVLFSRNQFHKGYKKITPYEKEKSTFASVYPFVYEVVKILKDKDHRTLPIFLQKLESYLFIDCIAKKLVGNGIVPFTIHDSIIVKAEYQVKTIEIMNDVFFNQIGVIPSFDIKKLKD
jgi:hypothetical protein